VKLLEAVIALTLGVLLLVGTWHQATSIRRQVEWAERIASDWEARRIAGLSLDLDAEGVVGPAGPDEVAVRAYRWWGVPCADVGVSGVAVLSVLGLRRPDANKDSLVLIDSEGRSVVGKLRRSSRSAACSGPAVQVTWDSAGGAKPVLVRGFERGVYRIDSAFRYRRGAGGAQPLTAARFKTDSVSLWVDGRRVGLRLAPLADRLWAR
jgi:hypothetical protein